MNLNKTILLGNLTRDPELKALPSGTKVCSMAIATNSVFKDKDGNRKEQPEFHNIVVFGQVAENCALYLKKGQSALVEGRIQTRSWETDGVKKYRTEIVADRVQFGPKAQNGPRNDTERGPTVDAVSDHVRGAPQRTASPVKPSAPAVVQPGGMRLSDDQIDYPAEEINPDDIPF